jgi:hypothetical protein
VDDPPLLSGTAEGESETVLSVGLDAAAIESNKQTAEAAKNWLIDKKADKGYRGLTRAERIRVAQAFAARNKVVYGQAFDLVRVSTDQRVEVDFDSLEGLSTAVRKDVVTLIEVTDEGDLSHLVDSLGRR